MFYLPALTNIPSYKFGRPDLNSKFSNSSQFYTTLRWHRQRAESVLGFPVLPSLSYPQLNLEGWKDLHICLWSTQLSYPDAIHTLVVSHSSAGCLGLWFYNQVVSASERQAQWRSTHSLWKWILVCLDRWFWGAMYLGYVMEGVCVSLTLSTPCPMGWSMSWESPEQEY